MSLWLLLDRLIPDFTYMVDVRVVLAWFAVGAWLVWELKMWRRNR